MGLDFVEIVIRTEEVFAITLADHEAEGARTVGDLYKLVCEKLNVSALEAPVTFAQLPTVLPKLSPWSPQTVWDSLVALIADQQGIDPKKILCQSSFVEDLGVD